MGHHQYGVLAREVNGSATESAPVETAWTDGTIGLMVFHPERTAIVGATGPTGSHLVRERVSRGRQVRVVSRRRDHLEQVFAGLPVEIATADALDPESLARAVERCDLVVDAIGLPPERMSDHPATARHRSPCRACPGPDTPS